jgi:hypothetical protein
MSTGETGRPQYMGEKKLERTKQMREEREKALKRKAEAREAVERLAELSRRRGRAHSQQQARQRKPQPSKQQEQQDEEASRDDEAQKKEAYDGKASEGGLFARVRSLKARTSCVKACTTLLDVKARRANMRQYGDQVRKRRNRIAFRARADVEGTDADDCDARSDDQGVGDVELRCNSRGGFALGEADADVEHVAGRDSTRTNTKSKDLVRPKTAPLPQDALIAGMPHSKNQVLQLLGSSLAQNRAQAQWRPSTSYIDARVDGLVESERIVRMQALRDMATSLTMRISSLSATQVILPQQGPSRHAWAQTSDDQGLQTSERSQDQSFQPRQADLAAKNTSETTYAKIQTAAKDEKLLGQPQAVRTHDAGTQVLQEHTAQGIHERVELAESDQNDGSGAGPEDGSDGDEILLGSGRPGMQQNQMTVLQLARQDLGRSADMQDHGGSSSDEKDMENYSSRSGTRCVCPRFRACS